MRNHKINLLANVKKLKEHEEDEKNNNLLTKKA
jgi:hypothetical protein